METAQPLCF